MKYSIFHNLCVRNTSHYILFYCINYSDKNLKNCPCIGNNQNDLPWCEISAGFKVEGQSVFDLHYLNVKGYLDLITVAKTLQCFTILSRLTRECLERLPGHLSGLLVMYISELGPLHYISLLKKIMKFSVFSIANVSFCALTEQSHRSEDVVNQQNINQCNTYKIYRSCIQGKVKQNFLSKWLLKKT